MADTRLSLFGKMLAARSTAIKAGTFKPCLEKSQMPIFQCLIAEDGQPQDWFEVAEGGKRCLEIA